jgi:hypothetical protein
VPALAEATLPADVLDEIARTVGALRYGSIEIVVHESREAPLRGVATGGQLVEGGKASCYARRSELPSA